VKCDHCPAAGRCVVEWTNHTPYCEWAALGGDWRAKVEALSLEGPPASGSPSVMTVIGNALGAASRAAANALHGRPIFVAQAQRDANMTVCETCDRFDPVAQKCLECGCFLAYKPWLKTEKCPLGKWSNLTGD
jgi:hypothetical protein